MFLVIEADRSCKVSVSSNPLHIHVTRLSSSSSSPINCGTISQPWKLEAPAGQQINVSLLDFGLQQRTGARERGVKEGNRCNQQYGYILDKAASTAAEKRNVSICGLDEEERHALIHTSSSNSIEIVLFGFQGDVDDGQHRSLLGLRGK